MPGTQAGEGEEAREAEALTDVVRVSEALGDIEGEADVEADAGGNRVADDDADRDGDWRDADTDAVPERDAAPP
jgi:hypothetical protein